MVIQIYGTPNDDQAIRDLKKGDINDALSFEYEPFFCGVGTFTLELPLTTPFATELVENNLLYIKDDDAGFIIKNVKRNNDKITVVGYDLNGMLLDRITMERDTGIEGAEGKDCISGSTETCVKHFVEYNMISSPDNFRNYPRLAVAEDLGRGIANDSDLVGKECLEDVVRTLCEGAGLGYRIKLVMSESQTEPLLIFDVYEREDHTADQSERNRVIFSEGMGNLTQIERETGITAEKNAVWCDTGGENMFVYKTDEDGEPFNPVSWDRREEYISLSVTDSYDTEEIELTARKQMADKYAQTDSLTIEAGNPLDFGTVYKLGDIVTVYDKKRSLQLNSVISSVLIKRSGEEHSVQITLGERKPKLLDKYVKQNQLQRKAQTDFPPSHSGGSISLGALDTYTYLTDNSIEYNGLTYTIEKDDTGLITRITDDDLGEFSPKSSGNITDVAFHNAVLTAVAMLCGLPKPLPDDTLTDMVEYRYNIESYEQTSATLNLLNQADGVNIPLAFTGATLNSDNVYIVGNGNSCGSLAYTAPNGELNECTFYMVARGATVAALRFFAAASTLNSFGVGEGFSSQNGMWAVGAQANTTLFTSQFSSLTTAVLALRHYNGTLYFYVNGEYVGVCPVAAIPVTAGTFWFGITAGNWSDSGGYYYYDFAFAESAHDERNIIINSKYLMAKYGI